MCVYRYIFCFFTSLPQGPHADVAFSYSQGTLGTGLFDVPFLLEAIKEHEIPQRVRPASASDEPGQPGVFALELHKLQVSLVLNRRGMYQPRFVPQTAPSDHVATLTSHWLHGAKALERTRRKGAEARAVLGPNGQSLKVGMVALMLKGKPDRWAPRRSPEVPQ